MAKTLSGIVFNITFCPLRLNQLFVVKILSRYQGVPKTTITLGLKPLLLRDLRLLEIRSAKNLIKLLIKVKEELPFYRSAFHKSLIYNEEEQLL